MVTLINGSKSVSMHASNTLQATGPLIMKFGFDN